MATVGPPVTKQTAELGRQRQQRAHDLQRNSLNLDEIRRFDRNKETRRTESSSQCIASGQNKSGQLSQQLSPTQSQYSRGPLEGMGGEWGRLSEEGLLFAQLLNPGQEQDGSRDSDSFSMHGVFISQSEVGTDTSEELAQALTPYFKNSGKVALDVLIHLPRLGNIRVNASVDDQDVVAMTLAPEEEQCRQLLLSQQNNCTEGLSQRLGRQVELIILDSEITR